LRRLGIVLMTMGLIGALVALAFGEMGSAALDSKQQAALETAFYVAVAMCVAGALMFSVRVLVAKRRR